MSQADNQAVEGGDMPGLQIGPLLAALERNSVDYIVVGSVAAQLHGATVPTYALDITPNPSGPNLERLRAALVDTEAREYVPGFGFPLQLSMDRRRLSAEAPLRTVTRFGSLDVIPRPHGTDGYRELSRRSRDRQAHGLIVPVADLDDVIRSHTVAARAKDGPICARLAELASRIRDYGLQPVHEQSPPGVGQRTQTPATPSNEEQRIHAALDAAAALATVFDDIRPALAAARRQLYQALDETDYGDGRTVMKRIQIARSATEAAHTEITTLRRELEPEVTERQFAQPPPLRGRDDSTTVLAYQAFDEISITRRLLADLNPLDLCTPNERDLLIEARIHASTADANLDLLQIQLERTARVWDLPDQGQQIPGPEL